MVLCPGPNGQARVMLANNNGKLRGFTLMNEKKQPQSVGYVKAPIMASYAKVSVNGGTKIVHLNGGSGYLSGNSQGVWKTKGVGTVEFYDVNGRRL